VITLHPMYGVQMKLRAIWSHHDLL
jgi:hypothetical protein